MPRFLLAAAVAIGLVVPLGSAAQVSPASAPSQLYFPQDGHAWETESPQQPGFKADGIEKALEYAAQANSSGVVVLHAGKILAERYWRPAAARVASTPEGWPIEDVASLQKSLVSVLVGIAVDRGVLQRDAPVSKYLQVGWSRSPAKSEARITVNHLLTMTSGLTESLEFAAAPGTKWFYNTPAYSRLIKVLEAATRKEANVYLTEAIASRIGMNDTRWIVRQGPGALVNPYGLATTARDLARLGLLMLSGGVWHGDRIVTEQYVREAVRPSQTLNPSYGLLWYANQRQVPAGIQPALVVPSAPDDLIAGQGAGQRRIYVVPGLKLVITRLGGQATAQFDEEFWSRFSKALPAAR